MSSRMKSTLTLAAGRGAVASSFNAQGLKAAQRAGYVTEVLEPTRLTMGPTHYRVWKLTTKGAAALQAA